MICSKSTVKATGFNTWYSGGQDHCEPEVEYVRSFAKVIEAGQLTAVQSVIAVQGLGAHPYYTWVGKQAVIAEGAISSRRRPIHWLRSRKRDIQVDGLPNIPQTASSAAETMWLRDLLPSLIPRARIATYSYESDWRRADVKTSLRKCGEQLLNVLLQNRSTEKAGETVSQTYKSSLRELAGVSASFGALVLANHGKDFNDIRLSTAGIIFLGTPHHGSDAAVYGLWLAQAVGHDKTLLESLRKNSPALYEIARDFETSYRDTDIVCFYENEAGSHGLWKTQLVDQQSATLHDRRMIYLNTDHSGLNKFYSLADENFCLVRPEIERMVQTAVPKIKARYQLNTVIDEKDFRVMFSLKGIPVVSNFVVRDAAMNQLREALLPASTEDARRKVFVLHGLGGIGKTQLAVEFARKHQTSYTAIFWIDSSTKEKLRQNIGDLASRLPQNQVSEKIRCYSQEQCSDVDKVVNEVLKWLSQPLNNQWLLVFDNVDREFPTSSEDQEAFDVRDYFPEADHGSILITSRLSSLWRLGIDMKLEPVDEIQGGRILENSFGKLVEGSSKLVRLLQGLPLAINQAGSYMRETSTNVADYMVLYDRAWRKLMKSRNSADRSVLTTWTLSFEHLRAQSEEAANLLLLWAFLDSQDFWYGLLAPALDQDSFGPAPDWLAKCVGDELDFKECMGLLLKYSFIDAKVETSSFSIHSVFHHWCRHAFEVYKTAMSRLAMIIVASAAPSRTILDYTVRQRRILPHCDCIFTLVQQRMQDSLIDGIDLEWQSNICDTLGILYSEQGRLKEAEFLYQGALTGFEKAWGAEHTSTLSTVHNLGSLYSDQGRLKEAEDMYLRALTGKEKAWGVEHTSTLDTVHNLGKLYSDHGRMKKAEDMYLRALTGCEKAWGAEHTSTLDTVNNLGSLYSDQGRMKEAEDMYLRALTGYEKAWGVEHTSTLNAVNNLGLLYSNQNRMKEAEDMYLRALAGYEKAWGAEHTSTLNTVNNLGILYSDQGRMKEAEDMYLRALTGKEKAWGAEHTSTLNTAHNLGSLYSDQGRMKEAEDMYLRALAGCEKAWGAEHTSTLETVNNLGNLYKSQGRMKEAEDMYLRALTGKEKAWGAEHTSTLNTVHNLGSLYSDQGRTKEAEDMYLRALAGREKAFDTGHKQPLDTRYNIAALYEKTHRYRDAIEQLEIIVPGYTKVLGSNHQETIEASEWLVRLQNKLTEKKFG
ncbi:hypothetical protein MMC07_005045 [Pseudocyphellaria aurata]|nr:hypothetical protein [Pseudocyphellaria aurata]